MHKILPGSIVSNPTLIQTGTVIDEVIDRGAILFSQFQVLWTGASVVASGNIELQMENPNGSFAVNVLPAGTYALGSDQLIIAYASRTTGTTTLTAGTYSSLTAGQYCTVALASLTAINLLTKDHYVLFRCRDTSSSIPQLIVPLNKQIIPPGLSTNLGLFPFVTVVEYVDPVSTTLPTGSSVMIDGNAGINGNRVLFVNLSSGNNEVYILGGVGTSITWTPVAGFSNGLIPSNGDQVKVLLGTIYADQLGIFTGTQWDFGDTTRYINSAGNFWEQTSLRTVPIVDGTTNQIFSVTALGSENIIVNYSVVRENLKDTGQLFITNNGFSATISGEGTYITGTGVSFSVALVSGNIVLSYTATAIGEAGTMNYFTQTWSDLPGGVSGVPVYSAVTTIPIGYLDSAYAQSDGSATANNSMEPIVSGGLTQWTFNFFYTMGVNAGSTTGDLEVIVDGQVIPRYLATVTTTAYYVELTNNTIQFWANLTSPAVSLEVRRKAGTVDTAVSNGARLSAVYDLVVGSMAQVLSGIANYSSINTAIQNSSPGYNILILNGTYSENVLIDRQIALIGKGFSTVISGALTFGTTTANAEVDRINLVGDLLFSSGSIGNYMNTCWGNSLGTNSDLGTDNVYEIIRN